MTRRPAPGAATRFLKLFCSSAEHESVTGDLLEQYQRGRGRLWYWRQVLAIVFGALRGRAVRRPLLRTNQSLIARGFAVGIVLAVLSAAALSDIWAILIVGILGGVFAGILTFLLRPNTEPTYALHKNHAGGEREIPMKLHRGINSASIAGEGFEGLPGLLMMIAFVFIFLGIFMPRRNTEWFGALFFIVEIGAAALYILLGRRDRNDSEQFQRTFHQINEPQDRTNGSTTHTK